MSLQTKVIGRQPTDHGPYDPNLAYGKKFQCTLFGCAWESLHDNNNTAPAVWDGGDTITPNLVDWKKVSGSYEAWLMNHDKPATSEQYPFNGMGRVRLQKNIVNGVNTLTQAMLTQQNTIYVIQYDFTLGEDITVPANCVLEFDGGSISGAYTLTFNNTLLTGKPNISLSTICAGSIQNKELHVEWFGAVGDGTYNSASGFVGTDNRQAFQNICTLIKGSNGGTIVFGEGKTYISSVVDSITETGGEYYERALTQRERSIFWFDHVSFVEMKLNGSTLGVITNRNPFYSVIDVLCCPHAIVKDGTIIGDGRNHSFITYHASYNPSEILSTHEWDYGICHEGGELLVENVNISHCFGDAILAGSHNYWNGNIYEGAYCIRNCELSYCGRQGLSAHATFYSIVENVHIHHIGHFGNNPGFSPMCGIDLEYEDQTKVLGNVVIRDCHIHDVDNAAIGCGYSGSEKSKVKSLLIDNCVLENGVSMNAMEATEGDIVFNNCKINNTNYLDGAAYYINCDVTIPADTTRIILYLDFKKFVNGSIINNAPAGTINVYTYLTMPNIFVGSTIQGFKNAADGTENYKGFNGYASSYTVRTSFYDCKVVDCDFFISEYYTTETNIFRNTTFDNCFIAPNLKSIFDNCSFKNCLSGFGSASSVVEFNNCRFTNDVAIEQNSRYGFCRITPCIGATHKFSDIEFSVNPVHPTASWVTQINANYVRSILKYTGESALAITFPNVTDCTVTGIS